MKTIVLNTQKKEMNVNDYFIINNYRKELEVFYDMFLKELNITQRCSLVDEINRLRKHLNMNKF